MAVMDPEIGGMRELIVGNELINCWINYLPWIDGLTFQPRNERGEIERQDSVPHPCLNLIRWGRHFHLQEIYSRAHTRRIEN